MLAILEKISPSEFVSNGYISNHNKVQHPHPKFKVSFFIFLLFLNQCYSNKLWKHQKRNYKESFLIVVSSWNRDLMLMLERPLSHYYTSPLRLFYIPGASLQTKILPFKLFFLSSSEPNHHVPRWYMNDLMTELFLTSII